jgi:CheY-like chemotaxis protein
LTAFVQPSDRERARIAGFQQHVAKPVDPGQLITTIAEVSSQRTATDKPRESPASTRAAP